jgi:ATP-dependent DNA helicase RecG
LALTLFGDLHLSVLDEMPPGRQEIDTRWIRPRARERTYAFVRGQVEKGRQAYIICPLVEESEKIESVAAVEEHKRLSTEIFPDLRVGLIHGRMKSAEKEEVMREYYAGDIDILVSTTVIEVGVDVPNSTVMMIENANRFGLAQLHQLRGRVGRGEHKSYCLLVSGDATGDTEERLRALEETNDGFELAEKDLELRGPGEFFGRRQSGLPELQLASFTEKGMLEAARQEAEKLFNDDPGLKRPEHKTLHDRVTRFWENAGDIS